MRSEGVNHDQKKQSYSKEFKAEAVRTVLENQLSISEDASRLSVPEGALGQWVTAARKGLVTPQEGAWSVGGEAGYLRLTQWAESSDPAGVLSQLAAFTSCATY